MITKISKLFWNSILIVVISNEVLSPCKVKTYNFVSTLFESNMWLIEHSTYINIQERMTAVPV